MDFSDNYNNFITKIDDLSKYSLSELENLLKEADRIESEYDNMQLVVKADANSVYGSSASQYYSLADFDLAESITLTGKHFCVAVDYEINNFFKTWSNQETLDLIKSKYPEVIKLRNFEEYVAYTKNDLCVYGDTDSRYIDFGKVISLMITDNGPMEIPESDEELALMGEFFVNKFINKIIKDTIEREVEYRNARPGYLKMNHEVTSRRAVFQGKKKYIMALIWKDGKTLSKPKLKFQGVEIKRGSSSPIAKKILSELINRYMLKSYTSDMLRLECLKLMKFIKHKKQKDMVYLISSVSSLNEIEFNKDTEKFYHPEKNHIQMQMAISWKQFIYDNKFEKKYKSAFEGQKMNYYYTMPNSKYKVIAIPDDVDINTIENLPPLDWNRMIIASIIKPLLRTILDKKIIEDSDCENFLIGVKQLNF